MAGACAYVAGVDERSRARLPSMRATSGRAREAALGVASAQLMPPLYQQAAFGRLKNVAISGYNIQSAISELH
jgi:hypothetical protein